MEKIWCLIVGHYWHLREDKSGRYWIHCTFCEVYRPIFKEESPSC